MAKKAVFIHTNDKQMVGAIVGKRSLKRMSADPDAFDVHILRKEDYPFFEKYEGRKYLRGGGWRVWENADLQSFTPMRFAPPERMGFEGRAVVIDPDIFAIGDVNELLDRDMGGKAVCAKPRPWHNGRKDYMATSVMLMDCEKLTHWRLEEQFDRMFRGELDYMDWIILAAEPKGTVGPLEDYWNDFDHLGPETRMLHNTRRRTQPWKAGLPIDYTNGVPLVARWFPNAGFKMPGRYKPHPDPRQEAFFFALLAECVEAGEVTEDQIREEMRRNHVRHDALEMIARAKPVEEVLSSVAMAA